jgi:colanic acid/amylovoran biosynthesis protein
MVIEIRRANFINKGGELMFCAVLDQVRKRYPSAKIVMAPSPNLRPFEKIVEHGLYLKASLYYLGFEWGVFASLLPKKIRAMYGIVLDKEVDVVLDVAGFAYGDQWGPSRAKELATLSKRWKKNNTDLIIMPQSLGPFSGDKIKKLMKKSFENATLVMPRDQQSLKYLQDLVGESEKIKYFTDFTNLIDGDVPPAFKNSEKKVCMILNYRMIDKTGANESDSYVPLMVECLNYLKKKNANAFILVHESEVDLAIAREVSQRCGGVEIIQEEDPLKIKGIIGSCYATIGSRFHGLVSALSQGVPSLATGWSHKYAHLVEDYGVSECLLSLNESTEILQNKIDRLIEPSSNQAVKEQLMEKSKILKGQTQAMWEHVFDVIDARKNA